jgi:hypothetical protein
MIHDRNIKIRYAFLLFLIVSFLMAGYAGADDTPASAKGTVKAVSNKAKTISASVEGKGVMIFKFSDATVFKNAQSAKDLQSEEAVVIEYKTTGPDNIALSVSRSLAKLPDGVTEIKTPELSALIAKGPDAGGYTLVDSRPAGRCSAGRIPTAVNIPVAELEKKGESVLPSDKNKLLIFYCGGPT